MTSPSGRPARCVLAVLLCLCVAGAQAADASPSAEAFLASLHPVTGRVEIGPAHAHVALRPGYSFLPANDAQRVLSELWHNPPDKDVLGMILPSDDPHVLLDEDSWAVVVTYVDDGYVSDADAAGIDYDKMLRDMQESAHDENAERRKQGFPEVELAGWAEPPHYDDASHKL